MCKIPSNVELPVPQEILAHLNRKLEIHAACLLLVIITRNIGVERQRIEHPSEPPVLEELHTFPFTFELRERFPILDHRTIGILEGTTVIVGVFIFSIRIYVLLLVERERYLKVGGIPRHRILAAHVEAEIAEREAFYGTMSYCITFD